MNESNNAKAVHDLLRIDDPNTFIDDLTEMWEAWITSDLTDGATASQRAQKLMSYKALCEMLRNISRKEFSK